ncbi:sirohydrochlorin cobaltochelatase [Saccharicrinis carchari]|uniref:Sirohydrochlorin cobaltochelatase n=1 Tax=Saccharicrinis carchari TaxID=1168039 RepID=A0A521EAA1_SACCC|nr:sirohydrochlorin cobaltochelatase [Saccharicrinis carchari]SMO80868.1 sirohydrochlorin cobaltochelatase [Saccharicrinis carchari]
MTKKTEQKRGILLVAFGTSHSEAAIVFEHIENRVKIEFPDAEVHWAYTSKIIRKILSARGRHINSPSQALAKMGDEGFTHVAVQSLHIVPGEEYDNLKLTVQAFKKIPKALAAVELGTPLLFLHTDIQKMAAIVHQTFGKYTDNSSVLILMGHGTSHASNVFYPGFQYYLSKKSDSYFMATIDGYPELRHIVPDLKKKGIKKVTLAPFLSVAGDHAKNDMAGKGEHSWKSILLKEGFVVDIIQKGLAEYQEVVNIWLEHLKVAYSKLR